MAPDPAIPGVFVGLNSARFEDQPTAGLGYVGEGQILEPLRDIRERGVDSGWRKIAVLHHHLVPVMRDLAFFPGFQQFADANIR